jgi:two-component system response regulator TctD
MRILLVEDNEGLAEWLGRLLRGKNFATDVVGDAASAEAAWSAYDYDLIILDLALPDRSGLSILREFRRRGQVTPVLVLTASAALEARVTGLDAGADDYLAKPFAVEELEARIRALLRRGRASFETVIRTGRLAFDPKARVFSFDGAPLPLTPRETAVLEKLALRAGQVVSKEQLAEAIFGFDDQASASAVEVYVHRVRRKIADQGVTIATLRGIGYVLRHAPPGKDT